MKKTVENLTLVAWVTSLVATLGSLYFSEVRLYEPCTLCWYQRIAMYPMVVILAIGVIRKDTSVAIYASVFSLIGICLSIYHYSIQKFSVFSQVAPSCGRVPCTGQYINWFGFVTIPFLAFVAFSIIFVCCLLILRKSKEDHS